MNNSSAQETYSITLNDSLSTYTGFSAQEISDLNKSTITITSGGAGGFAGSGYSSMDTITLSGGGAGYTTIGNIGAATGTISIGNIEPSVFTWKHEEFVDCFPDYDKVKEMCEQYPALGIAFKKFAEVYKMVEDDYVAQKGGKYTP